MFDTVYKRKRLLQVVLALLAIPFFFTGLEAYTRAVGQAGDVATVDGTGITAREFEEELRQQQERLRQIFGRNFDPAAFDTPDSRQALLDGMIEQRLVSAETVRAGLTVSDERLREVILAIPAFQEDGRFSRGRYEAVLRQQQMTPQMFEARVRNDVALGQLNRAVAETAILPREVAERLAAFEGQRREITAATVTAAQFLAQAKVEEGQAKALYDANPGQFRTAERVRVEYLVLSAEDLGRAEAVPEEELRKLYEARAPQYRVEEQRRASHILIAAGADVRSAERAAARRRAEEILAEARKTPARFAELAKKHSQDPGSADKGGDLGAFPRGAMVKSFEDAVFAMKEGEISGIVETEFGFHIVRLAAVQRGKSRSFEEVRAELAAEVRKQRAGKRFAEAAEAFTNLVYEQSDSLQPAAERFGLQPRRSDWIERGGQAPAPFDHRRLAAAVFSEDAIGGKRNTEAIEVAPGVLVSARVAGHAPATQQPFEEVRAQIEERLRREMALALARKDGEAKLAALQKGGDAAVRFGPSTVISRRAPQNVPAEAVRSIMAVDAAKLPAFVGHESPQGYVVFRVMRALPAEAAEEPRRRAELVMRERQLGAEQFSAYVASLRKRASVEINKANLEKKQ